MRVRDIKLFIQTYGGVKYPRKFAGLKISLTTSWEFLTLICRFCMMKERRPAFGFKKKL